MDSVDVCAATSAGDNKRRVNKKNRVWRKRLHLRKTAVQPPTMQIEDKHGPKKIAGEREQSTVCPASKKPPQEAQQGQHKTTDSRHTLRFMCSQCKDNSQYVPKDLVRHFEENHRGSSPVFSCHMCAFNAHEFSYLQVHLLSHRDTFSSCSICNDNVQRTWSEFSAHLTMYHCQNGKYSCEKCQKFSTGDVGVFLEHMDVQHFVLEGDNEIDLSLHTKDKDQFWRKTTTQALRCQHCSYEASQKWLLAKHVNANHVGQKSNQKKKKEVRSIAMKPNDPTPKIKPRLTRSAVREMCWLTQDCLSLPGREFLDKYCHLSDPQTTLEETQQFLMKSVAGETGDQKWTKALKTVLSNVPQDMNLHPKSENGITNSADLTVLTVKNKITVAQNGATYAKRLKMMASSEKETLSSESTADDARCVVDQNGCESHLNDHTQTETRLNNDASMSAPNEPSECTRMQENRENQVLKTNQDNEDHAEPKNAHACEDAIDISSELKVTNESKVQTSVRKAQPKNRRRNRRRKRRKPRSKTQGKGASGLALKIVLKKNPVKEMQWVSQSSLSPSGGGPTDDRHGLPGPRTTTEETAQVLQNAPSTEAQQKKWTKASATAPHDPSEAIAPAAQSKPGEDLTPPCAAQPTGSKNAVGREPVELEGSPSTSQKKQVEVEKSQRFLETGVDESSSTGKTRQSNVVAATAEMCPENSQLRSSGGNLDCHVSAADGVTPQSSYTKSSPVSQPAITPQGNSEDLSHALSLVQSDQSVVCPDLLSNNNLPAGKAIRQEPSPALVHRWQPVPKNLERTLKLIAINPSQLIKRPARDQPVVVLNHPDADIPEVARIMEVVSRYRGEVQKVVLSRRTLNALHSATGGDVLEKNELADGGRGKKPVQERFMLKLKLRRLSRKKYEVVGAVAPSRDEATKFRCWFCGRMFESQETWTVHRQRHLMEWKKPNCENS
ncbi:hypothetical protein PAMA_002079 [Pampus argenteus]